MRLQLSVLFAAVYSVMGVDWPIQVGLSNGFTFTPNQIFPAIGDTVTFNYLTRNRTRLLFSSAHLTPNSCIPADSATTTTFVNPCPPPPGGVGPNPFDSGL